MKADKPYVTAIIAGAGSGTRMGGVNKAFIKIGEKTAFRMVMEAFSSSSVIDEIVIVCRDKTPYKKELENFDGIKVRFAEGGRTRTQSVMNGVKAASSKSKFFCIHDCARPLVTKEIIETVVGVAMEKGAATACTPVTDTVKYIDKETGTIYTPDRSKLYALQTPQVFASDIYKIAAAMAKKDEFTATDDTAIAEYAGFKVEYVETDKSNIKLTSVEDVYTARFIDARRRKQNGEGKA